MGARCLYYPELLWPSLPQLYQVLRKNHYWGQESGSSWSLLLFLSPKLIPRCYRRELFCHDLWMVVSHLLEVKR